MTTRKRLTRVAPLSVGKIMAIIYLVVGVVFGLLAFLVMLFSRAPAQNGPGPLTLLAMAICYPIGGFLGGIITAAIYNLAASAIGGIELEFSDDIQV